MAHQVCHDVGKWVDSSVTEPLEKCVEQDCNWWCLCCNKWFCFIVWVVVTAVKWVVETVCEIVADVIDVVVAVVVGLFNIIVGIFTWNWGRVWDGFLGIVTSIVNLIWDVVRLITLGSLIGTIRDRANQWNLRRYVTDLIDNHRGYTLEERQRIKDALGINGGGFGFRLRFTAYRGYVTFDQSNTQRGVPDLIAWHNDPNEDTRVDLKILAGVESTSFWQRGRPEIVGSADLDAYLADPGSASGFTVFAMSNGVLDDKISAAYMKGSLLGLVLRFDKQDVQLTRAEHVRMFPSPAATAALMRSAPFNRTPSSVDPAAAQRDLCAPVTLAGFVYTENSYTGYAVNLSEHPCVEGGGSFPGNGITGSTFRDRLPDFAFRYVPIHEIGHTFGLCHVDGLQRVMLSTKTNSSFNWATIPEYWLSSGPVFTYDEAKSVWDYIIGNFSAECLATRQFD